MSARLFSLEPLGVPDAAGPDLIDVAAGAGFEFVSIFANAGSPDLPIDNVVTNPDRRRAMRARMDATGVRLLNLECFNLTPDVDVSGFAAALECGAELGARTATAIVWENNDRADALAKYCRTCDMAREHGIRVNMEFFAACQSLRTLSQAHDFVRDAERKNSGIVLDVLHQMRTSGGLFGLEGIDPAMIGAIQICDGPLSPPDDVFAEALSRMLPGEGEFPICEIVARLPQDLVIGVEVPRSELFGSEPPLERARAMYGATARLFGFA